MLRRRLLGLARDWGQGGGPLALLGSPPGELHDLGLICFGLALRAHGWRIAFLGASEALAASIGAELLDGDPVTHAARIVAAR